MISVSNEHCMHLAETKVAHTTIQYCIICIQTEQATTVYSEYSGKNFSRRPVLLHITWTFLHVSIFAN
jgi:hypothetical protein